ncbi:tyrosine-type recombinase/integrase [Dyadobacter jiangsuensis]
MKLTDRAIKHVQPKEKSFKIFDGAGLFIEVMPNGSKLWRFKYTYHGKEKRISLGQYPTVSLAEARNQRFQLRKQLTADLDPSIEKQKLRLHNLLNAENTFKAVAVEWHATKQNTWTKKHSENVMRKLEKNVFPFLATYPIHDLQAPELLVVLRKIEERGSLEIASRTRTICSQIFRFGIQTGRCNRDVAHDLRGALKTRRRQHFASIEPREIPNFLLAVERNDIRIFPRTRRAIKLSMLTFVRPGELRQARWSEIDWGINQWIIPAERMKMRRAHIVPLSLQAITILKEQQQEVAHLNTDLVFPSQINIHKPMSDNTARLALQQMGYKDRLTPHGFRALARTTIRERLNYAPDIIEAQLAHKASGPLGEAYNRAQFLEQRRQMMQDYADYLGSLISDSGEQTT